MASMGLGFVWYFHKISLMLSHLFWWMVRMFWKLNLRVGFSWSTIWFLLFLWLWIFKLKNSVDFKSGFLCIFEWFLWQVKMSVAMWIVDENVTIELFKWWRHVKCLMNDLNELWGCICLTCGYGMEIKGFSCVITLWVSCMLAWFPFG